MVQELNRLREEERELIAAMQSQKDNCEASIDRIEANARDTKERCDRERRAIARERQAIQEELKAIEHDMEIARNLGARAGASKFQEVERRSNDVTARIDQLMARRAVCDREMEEIARSGAQVRAFVAALKKSHAKSLARLKKIQKEILRLQ